MAIHKFELDVDDLLESFEELEYPRSQTNRKHPLPSVLMISVMGVLAAMVARPELLNGQTTKQNGCIPSSIFRTGFLARMCFVVC
ncbi:transposase family protein [Rubinisphaera italica]|uniref:H repeat-associated protein N-terminal domain-containing protein n=1 Tax=Rubinisphaera italica TaxID=2527969 RepID=A0A5C5XBH1_9PLAN|nr:transposase family protein [Rubinisphaera italica]TWT59623.1 hypothetical protein Pan54_03310 [Rubinisphaera italica]